MPASPPELTDAYRRQSSALAAAIALVVLRYWRVVRVDDIDVTSKAWLAKVIPLIIQGRERVARLAVAYASEVRRIEVPADAAGNPFSLPPVNEALRTQIETSLRVTGPVALKDKIKHEAGVVRVDRVTLERLAREAGKQAAGAAVRHVQNGGREVVDQGVAADRRSLGWLRVTKDKPCFFCAMLASRGPVYKEDSFDFSDPRFSGEGEHKVHDNCHCSIKPVYRRDDPLYSRYKGFEGLWKQVGEDGFAGHDQVVEFRHRHEGGAPRRPEDLRKRG